MIFSPELISCLFFLIIYVKNSTHFVESNAPIHSNQTVSLDVVSLFTKVPTNETLAVVWDKLAADPALEEHTCILIDNLMEMLAFCVETTYFGIGSDIYWQKGLAMYSPLLPVLATIYMEYFEEMSLGSTSPKPSMWLRFVNDTFILWLHQTLFDHMNLILPSIEFTMEKEQDKLPFLNVLVAHTHIKHSGHLCIISQPSHSEFDMTKNCVYSILVVVVKYTKAIQVAH